MSDGRLSSVLTNLVAKSELTYEQAAVIISAYQEGEPDVEPSGPLEMLEHQGRRKWLGELGGYIGGAFTLTAGLILLSRTWSSISDTGKLGILTALAAILFGAGVLVDGMRRGDASRRLAGTLMGFGAISAAGAGAAVAPENHKLLIASLVGFLISSLGYWRVRSASTHIALFSFFMLLAGSLMSSANVADVAISIVLFGVATTWFSLAYSDQLVEKLLGLLLGAGAMVVTAEIVFINGSRPIAYGLLAIVAVLGFRIYVTSGLWPPLAGAVGATTLAVGQIVGTTLGGALGAALGLLTAGIALLASSAWVLRRKK